VYGVKDQILIENLYKVKTYREFPGKG